VDEDLRPAAHLVLHHGHALGQIVECEDVHAGAQVAVVVHVAGPQRAVVGRQEVVVEVDAVGKGLQHPLVVIEHHVLPARHRIRGIGNAGGLAGRGDLAVSGQPVSTVLGAHEALLARPAGVGDVQRAPFIHEGPGFVAPVDRPAVCVWNNVGRLSRLGTRLPAAAGEELDRPIDVGAVGLQVRLELRPLELCEPLLEEARIRSPAPAQTREFVIDAEVLHRRVESVARARRAPVVACPHEAEPDHVLGLLVRRPGPPSPKAHGTLGHGLGRRGHQAEDQRPRPRQRHGPGDQSHDQRRGLALAPDLERRLPWFQAPVPIVLGHPRDASLRAAKPNIRDERSGHLPAAHVARVPDLGPQLVLRPIVTVVVLDLPQFAAIVPQPAFSAGDAPRIVEPQQIRDRMHEPRLGGLHGDDQAHGVDRLARVGRGQAQRDFHQAVVIELELGVSLHRAGGPRCAALHAIGGLFRELRALADGDLRLAGRFELQAHGRGEQFLALACDLLPQAGAIDLVAAERASDARGLLLGHQGSERRDHHAFAPQAVVFPWEPRALESAADFAPRSVRRRQGQPHLVRAVGQGRYRKGLAGLGRGQGAFALGQHVVLALRREQDLPSSVGLRRPKDQQPQLVSRREVAEPELAAIRFLEQVAGLGRLARRRTAGIGLGRPCRGEHQRACPKTHKKRQGSAVRE